MIIDNDTVVMVGLCWGLETWQEAEVKLSAEVWNSGLGGSRRWLWWDGYFYWQHGSGL